MKPGGKDDPDNFDAEDGNMFGDMDLDGVFDSTGMFCVILFKPMHPGHGAVLLPYVPAIVGESTNGVDDICLKVENFLSHGLLEDTLNKNKAETLRSNECVEVTVHGSS